MASIAAQARRLGEAQTRIRTAAITLAERVGVEFSGLSKNRDVTTERMFQMEALADLLERIVEASAPDAPAQVEPGAEDKPKRGRKPKVEANEVL